MEDPDQTRKETGQEGATAAEYALMISLIALFVLGSVAFFGGELAQSFSDSCAAMFPGC